MGFNALSKLWLLLLFIPLLIFYFLKLKRQRLKVPSLFLWQQVLRDRRVNSPFQRFKRHILLLLQILLLLLLIAAATEPYFYGNLNGNKRIPILIDNSASMGALDSNGETRLDKAKEKVRKMVNDKVSGQEYCLISFSNNARKECGFTDNSRILLDALENIEIQDIPGNIEDALRMVQAMARNYPFEEAVLLSDGNFPEKANFNLSFQLNFQKVSSSVSNLGVTAFSAQRTGSGYWQVFAELSGVGDIKPTVVDLFLNGKKFASDTFSPTSGEPEKISFSVPGEQFGELEIRINPNGFDALSSDNRAWLRLPKIRPLWVYISPLLKSIHAAMRGIEGISVSTGDINEKANKYDLIITDHKENFSNESLVLFSVGIIPPNLNKILSIKEHNVELVDWFKEDPLLRHVELGELTILEGAEAISANTADLEKEIASSGYEVLIFAKKGPLLLKRNWGGRLEYNLFFHPDKSTLPFRISFPIMIKNLIEITRTKAGLADLIADHTGVLPELKLQPETKYQIKGPNNINSENTSNKQGFVFGIYAPKTGKYTISGGDKQHHEIGVSLLNRKESNLIGIDKISFNELAVSADQKQVKSARSLWKLLAILASVMLLMEWWFFNKKPSRNPVGPLNS